MNPDYFRADVMRAIRACNMSLDAALSIMLISGPPGSDQRRKFNAFLNLTDIGFADPEVRAAFEAWMENDHSC